MCVLAKMEKAARQSTPPRTNLTTTTTLKSAATVAGGSALVLEVEGSALVLEVEGSALVLEVEGSALVLEDQKGLLLRLRKELGRALTRFASSTKFRRSLPSMKLAASACRIVRVIAARSKNKKRRLCRVHNSRHGTVQQRIQ